MIIVIGNDNVSWYDDDSNVNNNRGRCVSTGRYDGSVATIIIIIMECVARSHHRVRTCRGLPRPMMYTTVKPLGEDVDNDDDNDIKGMSDNLLFCYHYYYYYSP